MSDSNSDRDIFEEAREAVEQARRHADERAHGPPDDAEGDQAGLPDLDSLREIYDRNPYAVLGAAAGFGYVLGGGLLSPFTKRLTRMGMKALVLPVALSQLRELTHESGDGLPENGEQSEPSSPGMFSQD